MHYARGSLVNQVASDGASENVLALKFLAIYTAKDAFLVSNPSLPQDTPVAFSHLSGIDKYIFIGGEKSHWIKRVVNGLEIAINKSLSCKRQRFLMGV